MRRTLLSLLLALPAVTTAAGITAGGPPSNVQIVRALGRQGIRVSAVEASQVRSEVLLALAEARAHGAGNSKVDFAAIQIARSLQLDMSSGSASVNHVTAALRELHADGFTGVTPVRVPAWDTYFDTTVNLTNNGSFMSLVGQRGFHPVKISWEDIGRYEGSVWGDRISDVGIWVRRQEDDPRSARLALSVRRDSNFRDKVLVVPSQAIKIHQRVRGRTVEKTLPQRLAELGLGSAARDRDVIVSNQFAIVPVPARDMAGASRDGAPPRAAFTFSIFPYGSTNYVITDVIEGSHEAIVGPGQHQLLFANVEGQRAPFTASRAQDRPDLLAMEKALKAQGMDVDVQRYYLIQVPLRRDVNGVRLSNMGTPPMERAYAYADDNEGDVMMSAPQAPAAVAQETKAGGAAKRAEGGLDRVAIGHGEKEGPYDGGAGFRGARAEEPIRVTVVYFVTPVGEVTSADMDRFTQAFAQWDKQAIWGGSFVTKETF